MLDLPPIKNPYSLVLVFMFRPLCFPGSLTRSPPLFFYKLNLMFLTMIVFRSLVFYRKPPKFQYFYNLAPRSCLGHNFSILAPF
jgi:hypothetical protein